MLDFPLALVTGAAHRLGRAFALCLARHGYAILLHFHSSQKEAERTASEIKAIGVPVTLIQSDLATDAGIQELFSSLDAHLDHHKFQLKVLVNSAASMKKADLYGLSAAEWDATFALNLRAPYLLAQKAARAMESGGLIVNITDIGAHKIWTDYPAYVVSKAALETLTRLMAKTYAPHIRVNAIAPGLVLQSEKMPPEEWNSLVRRLPLQSPVSPADITGALEFLLMNGAITGQTIHVDGGYSLT